MDGLIPIGGTKSVSKIVVDDFDDDFDRILSGSSSKKKKKKEKEKKEKKKVNILFL